MKISVVLHVIAGCLTATTIALPNATSQPLQADIVVVKTIDAPLANVWNAWTTAAGIESFFAPKVGKLDPQPGGMIELWFAPNAPEGSRGSEGNRVHTSSRWSNSCSSVALRRQFPRFDRYARRCISTSSRSMTIISR
ncbi:MAG TPA: SRPBCC domain-containing protein [Casimicrobiaceae bacterium]|jgi:hypothetical protein